MASTQSTAPSTQGDEHTSRTTITSRWQDEDYVRWLKAGYGLKMLKEILSPATKRIIRAFHQRIVECTGTLLGSELPTSASSTSAASGAAAMSATPSCTCTFQDIDQRNQRMKTGCSICGPLVKHMLMAHKSGRIPRGKCEPSKWRADAWEMAKDYMGPGQGSDNHSPEQTDVNNILLLWENCTAFHCHIQDTKLLEMVRETRNDLMHNATMKITEQEMVSAFQSMIDLLSDPLLSAQPDVDKSGVPRLEAIRDRMMPALVEDELPVWGDKMKDSGRSLARSENPLSESLDKQAESLDKQAESLDNQAESLDKHAESLDNQAESIEKQTKSLDKQADLLNSLKLELEKRLSVVEEQVRKLKLIAEEREEVHVDQPLRTVMEDVRNMMESSQTLIHKLRSETDPFAEFPDTTHDICGSLDESLQKFKMLSVLELQVPLIQEMQQTDVNETFRNILLHKTRYQPGFEQDRQSMVSSDSGFGSSQSSELEADIGSSAGYGPNTRLDVLDTDMLENLAHILRVASDEEERLHTVAASFGYNQKWDKEQPVDVTISNILAHGHDQPISVLQDVISGLRVKEYTTHTNQTALYEGIATLHQMEDATPTIKEIVGADRKVKVVDLLAEACSDARRVIAGIFEVALTGEDDKPDIIDILKRAGRNGATLAMVDSAFECFNVEPDVCTLLNGSKRDDYVATRAPAPREPNITSDRKGRHSDDDPLIMRAMKNIVQHKTRLSGFVIKSFTRYDRQLEVYVEVSDESMNLNGIQRSIAEIADIGDYSEAIRVSRDAPARMTLAARPVVSIGQNITADRTGTISGFMEDGSNTLFALSVAHIFDGARSAIVKESFKSHTTDFVLKLTNVTPENFAEGVDSSYVYFDISLSHFPSLSRNIVANGLCFPHPGNENRRLIPTVYKGDFNIVNYDVFVWNFDCANGQVSEASRGVVESVRCDANGAPKMIGVKAVNGGRLIERGDSGSLLTNALPHHDGVHTLAFGIIVGYDGNTSLAVPLTIQLREICNRHNIEYDNMSFVSN